jgi:hypothetical protein
LFGIGLGHTGPWLANRIFSTLEELQKAVMEALREYWEKPEVLISMTAYSWWRDAVKSRQLV